MQKQSFIVLLTTIIVTCLACKDTKSPQSIVHSPSRDSSTVTVVALPKVDTLYTWVDKLRLRAKATTQSKVIKELQEGEILFYFNKKTSTKDKVNIRGKAYNEPWLNVKTTDNKEGWVYGGGVVLEKPKFDEAPSPYDDCQRLLMQHKLEAAAKCKQRIQKKTLQTVKRWVSPLSDGYELTLLDGRKIQINNSHTRTDSLFTVYTYSHYLSKMSFHVLEVSTQDSSYYMLVNDKSGRQTPILDYPKASLNNRHLVIAAGNALYDKNSLEIWGYSDLGFQKVFEKKFDQYTPLFPKWLDKNTIEITFKNVSDKQNKNERDTLVQIVLENGDWTMPFLDDM